MMTKNRALLNWVDEVARMTKPDKIFWIDGSREEKDRLLQEMVEGGMATLLNPAKRPGCYLFRSDASDVARLENRTYIASIKQEDAGPTNNWIDPEELKTTMQGLYDGCMKGRTMYIIPFSMGPIGSKISKIGIEITDSAYVVVNMGMMTRMGKAVHTPIGFMPAPDAIDIEGLDVPAPHMEELLSVNKDEWNKEIASVKEYYAGFGDKVPAELTAQLKALERRMNG